MTPVSAFAYAQARIQARYGQRPNEAVWEMLHALAELPAWLEQARASALRHWIANIGPATPPHEAERLLRTHLRALIEEVSRWVPPPWRAAVRWTAILPDLPAAAYLLRGEAAHDWMREDPNLRALANAEPGLRRRVLAQGPWAALGAARADSPVACWLEEWRRRWPGVRGQHAALEQLVKLVRAHRLAFGQGEAAGAWAARRAFTSSLEALLRRAFLSPVAVFAWLLLVALELERLRAELLTRALFPPGEAA